ncbi:hypothetical protein [Allokutzneria oryzae]|uniref:Immunity protein 35 domain-containing protein n=1 Tax=Allokutzneria oryzae TaxID=1378989 RepID=A0ABV5ZT75_9PSEU
MSVHDVIRALPDIDVVRARSRAMAMLDAALSPEWDFRYYSYNSAWSPTEELASFRSGGGDSYSIVFSPAGAYVNGFDHESPLSPWVRRTRDPWPGMFDGVPAAFQSCVDDIAFRELDGTRSTTFCLWREHSDPQWRTGKAEIPPGADDGASWLLELLVDGRPESYHRFAETNFETRIDLDAVRHVFALRPLTAGVVAAINPDASPSGLGKDIAEIGYPAS